VPDLVPREDLINAVGLNSLLFNLARAVGPAVAGLLFVLANQVTTGRDAVTLGAVCCFALNAASFLAVLVALRGIRVPEHHEDKPPPGSGWDGVRYLRENTRLGAVVLLTFVVCVFGWPVLTLLPAYTRLQLGLAEQTYSLLVSSLGAGALVGALATATFGTPARRRMFLLIGVSATAGGIFGLALAADRVSAALGCGGVGFGLILFLSTGQSTLQLAVPDEKRGRVMALWAMTLSASAPLGHLLAGQCATTFGVAAVLKGMALGTALSAVVLAIVLLRGKRLTGQAPATPSRT
jgi:predicted MFS family arabinose efflux permease